MPFVCNKTFESVLDRSEGNSELVILWFENNYMKLNTDKCHLFISRTQYEDSWTKIGDDKIWTSKKAKFLCVTIDNKVIFDSHIANICLKANKKLKVLSRLVGLLTFDGKQILFKAFFECQFKYCPLTLFRIGFFGAAHRWVGEGGEKRPPFLKSVTHILP